MPLVRVSLLEGEIRVVQKRRFDSIHKAMVEPV